MRLHLNRITAAFCLLVLVPTASLNVHAQEIALTFDDGPKIVDTTRMTAAEKNAALLSQLKAEGVKSALFLTLRDADAQALALTRKWGEEGHMIGNHTATHPSLDSSNMTLKDFEAELLRCDAVIRTMPGHVSRFRFPYLKEGNTEEKRDGFREFMKSISYQAAPVSVDASDWYYNLRLIEKLKQDPNVDLLPFRKAYLEHLWDRASYYDGLSKTVLGRSVKHVLLLHHNLINALFLRDVIQMFRGKEWKVIDAVDAFEDPIYRSEPDILPAGESILWALAKEKGLEGLRYPGEDGEYEKPILDRLGI